MSKYSKKLEQAKNIPDIFELVKTVVYEITGRSRAGLMLGLADLGNQPGGFFGGFFYVGTNIIIMNRIPFLRIKETTPNLFNPYVFHVLLHEYLHSLGYLDEDDVRIRAANISEKAFGTEHVATRIAADTNHFFPNLVFPNVSWQPEDMKITLVEGFDRGSVNYIG